MKSIFVICDKEGNPFTGFNGKEYYKMATAYKSENDAKIACKSYETIVEYRPKGK
jgi:hypothetical protein